MLSTLLLLVTVIDRHLTPYVTSDNCAGSLDVGIARTLSGRHTLVCLLGHIDMSTVYV